MRRLLLSALLVASPALAEDSPDIDRTWEIARATALDFSSTAEGYVARWAGSPNSWERIVTRYDDIPELSTLQLDRALDPTSTHHAIACTRIGPKGLTHAEEVRPTATSWDQDGDGPIPAREMPPVKQRPGLMTGLASLAAKARAAGVLDAVVLSCTFTLPVDQPEAAFARLLALAGPEFATQMRAEAPNLGAELTGGKIGPAGQILSLTVIAFPDDPAYMMIRTLSRSAPGS